MGSIVGVCCVITVACQKKQIDQENHQEIPSQAPPPNNDNTNSSSGSNPSSSITSFSQGSGGSLKPGGLGRSPKGALIYLPTSYRGSAGASALVVLWNSNYQYWKTWADQTNSIVIDTKPTDSTVTTLCNNNQVMSASYVDQKYLLSLIAEAREIAIKGYNVDLKKIFYAGWSHGGDLAMKFASLPTADTLAPDDRNEVFCSPPPQELLAFQKAAHVGQQEVAGVLAFPGHWGFHQLKVFKQASQLGQRLSCFSFLAGASDSTYGYAYQTLIPELLKVPGYQKRVFQKIWPGYGHNMNQNPAGLGEAMKWLLDCSQGF